MQLVPIKVTFCKHDNGRADYPAFNLVSVEARRNMKWSHFVDTHCIGWHYDSIDNLGTGHKFGTVCTIAPANFAEEAATLFPVDGEESERHFVEIMTESEFENFWDNRSKVNQDTEVLSKEVLESINVRIELERIGAAGPPSNEIKELRRRRLDPDDTLPGICKNHDRHWKDAKVKRKLEVASDTAVEDIRERIRGLQQ